MMYPPQFIMGIGSKNRPPFTNYNMKWQDLSTGGRKMFFQYAMKPHAQKREDAPQRAVTGADLALKIQFLPGIVPDPVIPVHQQAGEKFSGGDAGGAQRLFAGKSQP